jgi:hypothetical protein
MVDAITPPSEHVTPRGGSLASTDRSRVDLLVLDPSARVFGEDELEPALSFVEQGRIVFGRVVGEDRDGL